MEPLVNVQRKKSSEEMATTWNKSYRMGSRKYRVWINRFKEKWPMISNVFRIVSFSE